MEPLIEERNHILRILRLQGISPASKIVAVDVPPRAVRMNDGRDHRPVQSTFLVDPSSKTSRILNATRSILEQKADHQATFLAIYHALPKELLGSGRHVREHVRGTLQRAGHRQGIEYVNSDQVRLVAG